MNTEQESWLIERLREGVKIQKLFPYKFHQKRAYYNIYFYNNKAKTLLVLAKKMANHEEELSKIKIVQVFEIYRGEKREVESMKLSQAQLYFESIHVSTKIKSQPTFELTGKLYLSEEKALM